MNKTDLINKLAERLDGDKKTAQTAVEGFIDLVQREVQRGQKVSISGFGVFERRERARRTARNPRTGEAVKVPKTKVPSFRPGTAFKDIVSGKLKLPKASAGIVTSRALTAAARAATGGTPAAKAAPKAATKAAPKAAAKTATKAAPKAAAKAAPKAAPKTATKAAPKTATKAAAKTATKAAPKAAAKAAPKAAPKAAAKTATKAAPKAAPKVATKTGTKAAAKTVTKAAPKKATKKK